LELEALSGTSDFWQDRQKAGIILKEMKSLESKLARYKIILQEQEELDILIELGLEEADEELLEEVKEQFAEFQNHYETLTTETLLSGPYDTCSAILSLQAGAGGTESCDWVNMLYRMYARWAEQKDYKLEVLSYNAGEEVGIKSITVELIGAYAYGYLKAEKGIHRLVRLSPFDSSGRRHTTFASCEIMPVIEEMIDMVIKDEDLRIDTYRASGAGGQHINKTDSAIRITHLPTGTVVQCQNERSQHKNKDKAMQLLRTKLLELKHLDELEKMADIRGEVKEIGWGSQIRSYVMHPYNMVKDHRTNEETGNVEAVMNGQIDVFIQSYLRWHRNKL